MGRRAFGRRHTTLRRIYREQRRRTMCRIRIMKRTRSAYVSFIKQSSLTTGFPSRPFARYSITTIGPVAGEKTSRAVIVWSERLRLTGLWVDFNGDDPEALTIAEVESSLGERKVRSTLNDG